MNFTMWLCSTKDLGQTTEEVVQVFNGLSEDQKEDLQRQYEDSISITNSN